MSAVTVNNNNQDPTLSGKQKWDEATFTKREAKAFSNTDDSEIQRLNTIFAAQKKAFLADPYPSLEERIKRLQAIAGAIMVHREEMQQALKKDFVTHPDEFSDLIEILGMVGRVAHNCASLEEWLKPKIRTLGKDFWGESKGTIEPQPKGVIVNMAPWNFPFDIGIGVCVEAIAAGNRVVVKPSDLSIHTGQVLRKLMETAFPDTSNNGVRVVEVVNGGLDLSKAVVKLPWDHLVYTGGTQGAKHVMRACADNLVPVTLELGGKCPAILHTKDQVENQDVIDQIIGIKCIKNGQMCVSVDYVQIPEGTEEAFLARAKDALDRMVPAGYTKDEGLPSIITDGHAQRIAGLVEDAKSRGENVISYGGEANGTRRPPFHFIVNPSDDCKVMQQEIFGPVLPIKTFKKVEDAIVYTQTHDRPLGIGLFTDDKELAERVKLTTHSGGFNLNAGPTMHAAQPELGFGGIGNSGMGRHHGYEGFMEFSNMKACFEKGEGGLAINNGSILLPPYNRELTQGVIKAFVDQIMSAGSSDTA